MQGPPDTPYEKGVFELYCQFGKDYPVKPPTIRFVTRVSFFYCDVLFIYYFLLLLQMQNSFSYLS